MHVPPFWGGYSCSIPQFMKLDAQPFVKSSFRETKLSHSKFFYLDCPQAGCRFFWGGMSKTWWAYCSHYASIQTLVLVTFCGLLHQWRGIPRYPESAPLWGEDLALNSVVAQPAFFTVDGAKN